ncbi:hypothetical protein EDB89DRAFT_1997337 [Lactarius sanguifluus]|nr:hypothetical protein EDB89DRAFT_1997337 [Lactarius sanguifluus]
MSDTSTLPETPDAYELVPLSGAPTNYLLVSKKGVAIKGHYFIDLSILPPPPSVSGVAAGAKNLSLYTTSGAVTADVWVTGNNKDRQVSMKLCSDKGHVHAKIHDVLSDDGSEHRPSFDIDLRATNPLATSQFPRANNNPLLSRTHRVLTCARETHGTDLGHPWCPRILCWRPNPLGAVGQRYRQGRHASISGSTTGCVACERVAYERVDQLGRRTGASSDG